MLLRSSKRKWKIITENVRQLSDRSRSVCFASALGLSLVIHLAQTTRYHVEVTNES